MSGNDVQCAWGTQAGVQYPGYTPLVGEAAFYTLPPEEPPGLYFSGDGQRKIQSLVMLSAAHPSCSLGPVQAVCGHSDGEQSRAPKKSKKAAVQAAFF